MATRPEVKGHKMCFAGCNGAATFASVVGGKKASRVVMVTFYER